MKVKSWYLLLVLLMLFTFAIGASAAGTDVKNQSVSTRTITDTSGAEVTIPANVTRVVNLWPASNSVMLCMGAGDLLAGTMDITKQNYWSQFVYPDIVKVPTATDNAEELMKTNPDLIINPSKENAEKERELGLPAVYLYFNNYDSMKKAFAILGEILGPEYINKAQKWSDLVDNQIATVKAAVGDIPEEKRPVVYYIQGQTNQGLYNTFAANSIMNDWTTIAGGEFASKKLNVSTNGDVTPEAILSLNPDIIIIGGFAEHELYNELMNSTEWKDINAVKNNRVYTNPNGLFPWERFGMESALQIPFAASVIHPELYKINLVDEVKKFYKEFMDIELTDTQAQNMIDGYGPNGEEYKNVGSVHPHS
jgi:iron complex transport system substrate-binding protein